MSEGSLPLPPAADVADYLREYLRARNFAAPCTQYELQLQCAVGGHWPQGADAWAAINLALSDGRLLASYHERLPNDQWLTWFRAAGLPTEGIEPDGYGSGCTYQLGKAPRLRRGQVIQRPAWERLTVVGEHASLDGRLYALCGKNDGPFLTALIAKKGNALSASILRERFGEDAARIHRRLPAPIQRLIRRPTKRGHRIGYALK